jgi:hypothetical protein
MRDVSYRNAVRGGLLCGGELKKLTNTANRITDYKLSLSYLYLSQSIEWYVSTK